MPDLILTPVVDELQRAVRRQRRRRFLVRRGLLVTGVLLFGSGTAAALAVSGAFESDEPSRTYGAKPPEPGLRYVKRPIVLARGARGIGRSFEVVGYQLGSRDGRRPPDVCLDVVLLPEGGGHGCLSPNDYFQGRTGLPAKGFTYEGSADVDVASIRLTYRLRGGRRGTRTASLARADEPRTLAAVGIDAPFVIWRARLPSGAFKVRAFATGPDGQRQWTAADPFERAPRVGRQQRSKR